MANKENKTNKVKEDTQVKGAVGESTVNTSNTDNPKTKGKSNRHRGNSKYFGKKSDPYKGHKSGSTPKKPTNDPAWYNNYPYLVRDVANFSYNQFTGMPMQYGNNTASAWVSPGLCAITLYPTFGTAYNPSSAVNIAGAQLFTYIRSKISGSRAYEYTDVMITLAAIDQIYSAINWLKRIYAEVRSWELQNKYIPDALLRAEGSAIANSNIRSDFANFRAAINMIIDKAKALAVPMDIDLFKRHANTYKYVYVEGTSIKDGLYMYVPAGFYQYTVNKTTSKSELVFKPVPTGTTDISVIIQYVQDLINAIYLDEFVNTISGDILKAFDGNLLQLDTLSEDEKVPIVFDMAVLEQMKNATLLSNSAADVYVPGTLTEATNAAQAEPYLTFTPSVNDQTTFDRLGNKQFLTTTTKEVSPELNMENSRLIAAADSMSPIAYGLSVGAEVATLATYYQFQYASGVQTLATTTSSFQYIIDTTEAQDSIQHITRMSALRFHPIEWLDIRRGEQEQIDYSPIFDFDNTTLITPESVKAMHDVAIMSMLYVPTLASAFKL